MDQKFSLKSAGDLLGITANAMRARAKKDPEKYRLERDNGGKIWVWINPQNLPPLKTSTASNESSNLEALKASIEALKDQAATASSITELREQLLAETARADAAERSRDQAEADRDRWRAMAEKLADQPRSWWPWRRKGSA